MNYRGECGREGVGRMEWSEGGEKWDNCNSIINKYIFKKSLMCKENNDNFVHKISIYVLLK